MQPHSTGDEPIPGYRLARFLGQGGYGQVWAASGPGGIDIALKILSITGTRGGKELRAIGLVKKLRHPNLVPLYAYWIKDEFGNTVDGAAYESQSLRGEATELIIAMGLGDKSLATRLEECKKAGMVGVPLEELLRYIDGAAKAIDYLNQPIHNLGSGTPIAVSHCDIKPGNLLIVGNEVQLCDYGLARAITPDVRVTAATGAGTQAYSSPEMLANRPSDHSDQYSLAISYYELRTGRLPFPENEALHAHIQGRLDFSLVPPTEQEVLKRATHLEPGQRFPTAAEFLQGLREANKISGSSGSGVPRSPSASTPSVRMPILDDKLRVGAELIPGYELVKLLGRGGYGEVWQARGPGGISCALKIVRNLDGMQGQQEKRSLDLVKELDHERLIRLQAFWLLTREGVDIPDKQLGQPGAPEPHALVMATDLAAKSLLQYWQEFQNQGRANIPVADLMRIVRQSAEAIDYLNERDILHRDIKPENILLTKDLKVKVSDFGLAKLLEGSGAAIHQASVGLTLAYAAPELFDNRVTRWTDQYALALTYYRLRTGNFPFPNDFGPRQMMLAHTEGRLEFAGIRPEEERVLRKATSLDPQGRYPNCMTFVESLEQAHGMSAPSVGPGSRGSDFSIPPGGKSGVRAGSRGDDPRRTLVQDFTAGAIPQTDSRTEPFLGVPAVTVATDSQIMAELVESASVKETPGGNNTDLQATIIPQAMPLMTKKSGPRKVAVPTPDVDQIIHDLKAQKWKKLAILGGGSATAVGLITFVAIKMMNPGGGGTASTPATSPAIVQGGSGSAPASTPAVKPKDPLQEPVNLETVEGKLTGEVKKLVEAKNFAGAASAIAAARQKNANRDTCDALDRRVIEGWRALALEQKELPRKIEVFSAILKSYPADPKRDQRVESERLAVVQDLAECEIDARIAAADFAGGLKLVDAAQSDQRLKSDRADAVRVRLVNAWRVDTRKKLADARAISDVAKRLAALDALLGAMPAGAKDADLRAMRVEVLQDQVATTVEQFRAAKNFLAAAAAVKTARAEKVSADWADGLDESIRSDWRLAAAGKPTPEEQKAEYDRLLTTYPGYRIAEAERAQVEERLSARYASEEARKFRALVKDLKIDTIAQTRTELQAFLKKTSSPELQRQVQAVLTKLDEFEKDRERPADVATLDLLAGKGEAASKATNEELRAVAGLYQDQIERTAQSLVKTVTGKTDWSKLEAATRRFKTPWCESLHAEAVTEKLAQDLSVPAADRVMPAGPATGDLKAYRDYLTATRNRDAAQAVGLVPASATPSWASPHRFAMLYRILRDSAGELKTGGTLKAPFTDADAAFQQLTAAEALAGRADLKLQPDQLGRLQLDLALAALSKSKPDLDAARQRLDKVMNGDAIKSLQLGTPEEVQALAAYARTRDAGAAGRVAAIRACASIFKLLRENLAGVPVEFLAAEIIEPLAKDNGKAILGDATNAAVKGPAALLYLDAARNLVHFRGDWDKERGKSADPLVTALQFLDRAVTLEPSSDALGWRGLLRLEQANPNLELADRDATAALKADDKSVVAHTLRGAVDAWQGKGQSDYAKRVEICKQADEEFRKAETLAGKRDDKKDELLLLYKHGSLNAVQLANVIASNKDKSTYLDRAIDLAQKLLDLDSARFDARDTKGCALEDKAWLIKPPDRFGEEGAYAQAIAAFTDALNGLDARAVAQMHRGRCKFKLIEDRVANDPAGRASADKLAEQLADARSDLTDAIAKLDGNYEALESHFWKAKIDLLRYRRGLGAPEKNYDDAATEFQSARKLAEKLGQQLWSEPITLEWAMAAIEEARRLIDKKESAAKVNARLKEAIELADSAKAFSKPWYAYLRMLLLPLERPTGSRGKQYYDDLSARAAEGLGEGRLQDRPIQFRILALRSESRSSFESNESTKPELALADALAAEKLAKEASLSRDDQGYAAGLAGQARFRTFISLTGEKREAAREKPREDFRRALELSPNNPAAWQWKAMLAMSAKLPQADSVTESASYAAEAYAYLRDAEETAPSVTAPKSHERNLVDFARQLRDDIEKKYKPILELAIREKPDSPERPLWQLTLTDMLLRTGGDTAQARELFSAAQKGLAADAKKAHESQIRRIEQALKARK